MHSRYSLAFFLYVCLVVVCASAQSSAATSQAIAAAGPPETNSEYNGQSLTLPSSPAASGNSCLAVILHDGLDSVVA
ncbi:MAG: hypothetical protein WCA22_07440, partial [Candidatus Binatus sp.]